MRGESVYSFNNPQKYIVSSCRGFNFLPHYLSRAPTPHKGRLEAVHYPSRFSEELRVCIEVCGLIQGQVRSQSIVILQHSLLRMLQLVQLLLLAAVYWIYKGTL